MNRTAVTDPMPDSAMPLWRKIWEFPLVAMIVALVILVVVLYAFSQLLVFVPTVGDPATDRVISYCLGTLVVVITYKTLICRLGKQSKDDLPFSSSSLDIVLGFGVGAAVFTTIVGVAAIVGAYRILGWGSTDGLLEILVVGGLWAGVSEEIALRGIIFRWTEEFAGSWVALLLSSFLFGAIHYSNPSADLKASIFVALEAGILLGGAYMLTRNLWLAIGLHAGWNVTQGFIWGVPVSGNPFVGMVESGLYGPDWLSGGAFGLEASVIALVIATSAGAWIVWQARKEGHIVRPMWSRGKDELLP